MKKESTNFPVIIQIKWKDATETLLIENNTTLPAGEKFHTTEIWHSTGEQVNYLTSVISHEIQGSAHQLKLQYLRKNNPELSERIDTWGTSTLNFDTADHTKESDAYWKNIPENKKFTGPASEVTVHRNAGKEQLGYVNVLRKKRRQAALRSALTDTYTQCALTKETEFSSLEAAHIDEVANDGGNHIQNGLLLRADVHRLFDRGLIYIDPNNGQASLSKTMSKTSKYISEAKNWRLESSTLKIVRAALQERMKELLKSGNFN